MIWTSTDIEQARRTALAPLLVRRGYQLRELGEGAWLVANRFPGILVRGHHWSWPKARQQGNTIDFLMYVEGLTFAEIMRLLRDEPPDIDDGEEESGQVEASHASLQHEGDDTDEDEEEALPDWIRTIRLPGQSTA